MTAWLPCIVRVGGLPTSAIDPFHSRLCERIEDLVNLEAELERTRAHALDILHEAVPLATPDVRRLLLCWKRACFNRREVGSNREQIQRVQQLPNVLAVMERLTLLEAAGAEKTKGFFQAFAEQLNIERKELAHQSANSPIARGIVLASPSSAANLNRLREYSPEHFGRKELKLEHSLLRFISRATLKLSPFSTLTPVGLGILEEREASDSDSPTWFPGPFQQRSLLRLKRYLFHQIIEVLFTVPELHESLSLTLNTSLEEISPSRFRFFRRGYRGPDPSTRGTRFNQPSILRMNLNSPMVHRLRSAFGGQRLSYAETLATLESFFGSLEHATSVLDDLVAVGCLEPLVPWSNTDTRAETQLLNFLLSLPCRERLTSIVQLMSRIVELEDGFAEATTPGQTVEEIAQALSALWTQVISYAGLEANAKFVKAPKGDLYEDVFLTSPVRKRGEIVALPRRALEKAMTDVEPLLALGNFYDRRVDFLMTCSVFIKKRWPGRNRLSLMDVFSEAQLLYKEYLRSEANIHLARNWAATFNPYELESLKVVKELRIDLAKRLEATLAPSEDGVSIVPESIGYLLSEIPQSYALLVGGCLFIQPARASADLWVLNRLSEGTGRYSSRYTAIMAGDLRQQIALHFQKGSRLEIEGQNAEILDLLCAQGDTLNVHILQTPRVLEFPGENSGAPPERRLTLRDVSIELSGLNGESLRLVDSAGTWLLPAHLGGTRLREMPILVKFLSLFGPGELKPVIPMPQVKQNHGVMVRERVTIGRVVVLRRRWKVPIDQIPKVKESKANADFFFALNRWRLGCGLPERLFVLEKRPLQGNDIYKPQYIDFTSPSFIGILHTMLKTTTESLVAEELLPEPNDFPESPEGQHRALELQLEAVTFGPRRINIHSTSASTSLV